MTSCSVHHSRFALHKGIPTSSKPQAVQGQINDAKYSLALRSHIHTLEM